MRKFLKYAVGFLVNSAQLSFSHSIDFASFIKKFETCACWLILLLWVGSHKFDNSLSPLLSLLLLKEVPSVIYRSVGLALSARNLSLKEYITSPSNRIAVTKGC